MDYKNDAQTYNIFLMNEQVKKYKTLNQMNN